MSAAACAASHGAGIAVRREQVRRRSPEGDWARRRILLLAFLLRVARLFREGRRVQLTSKLLNSRNDARGGAVHGIADGRVTTIADSMQDLPGRENGELFHFAGSASGLRLRKYEEIRLQTRDFFQVRLRLVW